MLGRAISLLARSPGRALLVRRSQRRSVRRQADDREDLLLRSGLAVARARDREQLAHALAAAAGRIPGVLWVHVELAGGAAATADGGRSDDARAAVSRDVPIYGCDEAVGFVRVALDRPLAPDDHAALELLALQAGATAQSLRLRAAESERRVVESELDQLRMQLTQQRLGLDRLIDAHEDERRRVAMKLQEDLAQVLAGVLMGLKLLRRGAAEGLASPMPELHAEISRVLTELRAVAGTLRPASLADLGLEPALRSLSDVDRGPDGVRVLVEAIEGTDDLEPELAIGIYRIVEEARLASRDDITVSVWGVDGAPTVALRLRVADARRDLAALRAHVDHLGGGYVVTEVDGDVTVLMRLPPALRPSLARDVVGFGG